MLKNRLYTALLLGALFLAALYKFPEMAWAGFLLVFIAIGAWEWGGLVGYEQRERLMFLALILGCGLILLPGLPVPLSLSQGLAAALITMAALFWLFLVPPWLMWNWRMQNRWLSALVGLLVLLPTWVALVQLRHMSPDVVLTIMTTVWLADSAAYFCGKRFGRRKLAPRISPGKTWEGLLGAWAAVAAFFAALCYLQGWSAWFILGALVIVVFSVVGDLFESLMKRHAGKKDSGAILPGHGGVLDRIDALTSTLPLVTFYFYLFPLPVITLAP